MYYELLITTRKSINSEKKHENIQFPSLRSALERAMFETKTRMNTFFWITVIEVDPEEPEHERECYFASNS